MPICRKCDSRFPNCMVIDGKQRVLNKRKFCLECSPFGKHNTKSIISNDKITICSICKRFYEYNRFKGHLLDKCNSCSVNKRKNERLKRCVDYLGGECIRCGYKKSLKVLCFHHREPSKKSFIISGNHCRKWEVVKSELDKCDLLCSNCHIEIHEEKLARSELNRL